MGTRASFFIGDPCDLEGGRKYIGSFHWDGFPDTLLEDIGEPKTEEEFIDALKAHVTTRDDWCGANKGFPYPWDDDLFLTDYVYAFIDGRVQFTNGYSDWRDLSKEGIEAEMNDETPDDLRRLPKFDNVPAPGPYNKGDAGFIVLSVPAAE